MVIARVREEIKVSVRINPFRECVNKSHPRTPDLDYNRDSCAFLAITFGYPDYNDDKIDATSDSLWIESE